MFSNVRIVEYVRVLGRTTGWDHRTYRQVGRWLSEPRLYTLPSHNDILLEIAKMVSRS
jgi:hypothetical protein